MPKIAIIGAGSWFCQRMLVDIMSFPELRESAFALVDINPDHLEPAATNVSAGAAETVTSRLSIAQDSSSPPPQFPPEANQRIVAVEALCVMSRKAGSRPRS